MIIETYTIGIDFRESVSKGLSSIDNQARQVAENVSNGFRDSARRIQSNLEGIRLPALAVAGGGVAAFRSLTKGASELQESMNAINVVFGQGVTQIEEFGKQAATTVGLSQKEFNKLSTQTGALLGATGLSEEDIAAQTIELTKRAADLASVFDTDVVDAMSAVNQAIRGETEAIRRYAGDVTDATLANFLQSKGIKQKVKDLTQEEKRLYRIELILAQTAKAQNDFSNTSTSTANQLRIQSAQVENVADSFGTRLLPVLASIQRVTAKVIDAFSNLSPETQDLIVRIGLAATAISAFLVVASFIAPAMIGIATALKTVGLLFGSVFISNPIGIAISALVISIGLLWDAFNGGDIILNKINDWFVNKFPSAAEKIRTVFESVKNYIQSVFDSILNKFNSIIELPSRISNAFTGFFDARQPNSNSAASTTDNSTTQTTIIERVELLTSPNTVNELVDDVNTLASLPSGA